MPDKGPKAVQWSKTRLFTNGAGAIGHPGKKTENKKH